MYLSPEMAELTNQRTSMSRWLPATQLLMCLWGITSQLSLRYGLGGSLLMMD